MVAGILGGGVAMRGCELAEEAGLAKEDQSSVRWAGKVKRESRPLLTGI